MVKPLLTFVGVLASMGVGCLAAQAQATLGTSPYTESFDNLAGGLPTGFSVYTNASASSLGTAATAAQTILTPGSTTLWTSFGAGFKNFASATGLHSPASTAAQGAAPNRALGVRQTGSFGDNTSTATPPTGAGPAFVFQVANTTGKANFALSFKLQSLDSTSTRTATWQVDYGTGTTPTAFTKVGSTATTGPFFANTTVTASFGTALDNLAGPVWIRIVAPAATTGTGNRPSSAIDDFALSWNTPTASTPTLAASPGSLTFGSQNINTTSATQTYSLSGSSLTAATTVTVTGPFTISKDNATYGTSLSYAASELATAQQVYVKFAPTATGAASGTITNASAGATSRTVALLGTGADPSQTVFNFNTCSGALSDGWTQYSVSGAQTWACTTFGRDPNNPTSTAASPYGVQINGYAGGNQANEDWFISPAFDLSTYNYPLFQFWSRTAFSGPALKLRVSTNYSGTGAPSAATWTDLNAQFPGVASDTWTQSNAVNLAAYKGTQVYVAFVYTSTTAGAARWTLDDIALTNASAAPAPTLYFDASSLAFGYQAVGSSGTRTLTVSANDLTSPVTLTSSNPAFTLSKDGTTFASTISLTVAEVSGTSKAVTVRFSPTAAATSYAGSLAVASTGASGSTVALSGDTYDVTKTLEVVNWNMEWFGSTVAGNGPTDKNLQQANASTVINYLRADVYALVEVVDTVRLQSVVTQLAAATGFPYAYVVSRYGSYGDNPQDPDYAGDQKLALVYRTDVVKNPVAMGLLRCTEAQNCPAYNAWAGGRFPYLVKADVTLDGVTKSINFIVLHAKANATATSANDYARRQLGAQLLDDLLGSSYAGQNTLIVGDYNDVLNGTIATGVSPAVSSYSPLLNDPNYVPLSLPLANAGAQSTVSYPTLIDNIIASKQMAAYYISGTAAVRTDAAALVANYGTTTSDHYPVFSRYSLSQTALAARTSSTARLALYPNPVGGTVRIEVPETGPLSLQVVGVDGRLVLQAAGTAEQLNQQLGQRVGTLASGLYLLRVTGQQQTYLGRFQKL